MNTVKAEKDEIFKLLGDKKEEKREMEEKLKKTRNAVNYASEADIDERINQIDRQMREQSLSLKEEKNPTS
jgi:hypothetical protein